MKSFKRKTLAKGQPVEIECYEIDGQNYTVTGGPLNVLSLEEEWYEDVKDPERVLATLRQDANGQLDLFTFWQRIPDVEPRHAFHREWENVAVLPITNHEDWLKKQISSRTRSQIKKSLKDGVELRECAYDEEFVRGMTEIFNEAPVRQGRKFWHYGKDFETVKEQFSTYLYREDLIGAFYKDEMIGFIMMGNAGHYGVTGQIISKISHRDKSTNNLLISKAVEVCARKDLPYLVYLHWTDDSLSEFKRRCGFEKTAVPRYFVPLTAKGTLGLRLGLQRGWKATVPKRVADPLKRWRRKWNELRASS